MKEVTLSELDPRLQKQVENARKVVTKNPAYAIDIMSNIVARNPACVEARQILRKAQNTAHAGKSKGLSKFMTRVTSIPFAVSGDAKVKKDPVKAMESAEDLIKANPMNAAAHKLLGSAAESLEMNGTAALAYECLYKMESSNTGYVKGLMAAYIELGRNDDAIRVGEEVYRKDPTDEEIQALIKKASVQQTMDKGRWEEDKSFRDKLKDEEESQKLEQASRSQTGEEGLRMLVEEAIKGIEAEPGNMNLYRDVVSHYRKLGEFDNALEWIGKARELEAGRADVNLERLEGAIKRDKMTAAIEEQEAILEGDPENAVAKDTVTKLRAEERAFRREQSEQLVQRYPNEFSYRYELGELYFEDGETDASIKELQLALRSPKVRVNSLVLLGKAYKKKNFHDMAAEQFVAAKSEIAGVNEQKKEVLYELGDCYEQQGDMEKAMAEYKSLYSADIAYLDVAQKIDDFYSKKNG
jgi:tetratricopeptide (TPR) repeat protein